MGAHQVKSGKVTMAKGNGKLDSNVLIFNLPVVKTCPNHDACKSTCYAKHAELQYLGVKRSRERNWEATLDSDFVSRAIECIQKSKRKMVRIHESGDFYSWEYAMKWQFIAHALPDVQFFFYSKSPWVPVGKNLNYVRSILPDGSLNYGTKEDMLKKAKQFHAKMCPYKLAKKSFKCGRECKACQKHQWVVFIKH